ncbi:unnamed protein product [Clonostachys solani]|uniref:Uncharacterized protein n=1 Tax=Clonostachys solani TaxID=160281 RepID=A0A9N9Z6D1_9HYPO|nr:unnamed protein product [Clonostachys solani]
MSRRSSDSVSTVRAADGQSTPRSLDKPDQIIEALQQLSVQMDQVSRNISGMLKQVVDKCEASKASRNNRLASSISPRIQNDDRKRSNRERMLKDPLLPFLPLVNSTTGGEIPSFPSDLKALNELNASDILPILDALGVETTAADGTSLRERLRQAIM